MLKKFSLIGLLVFSSFEAYSAGVPGITVDEEPSSPAYVARGRGNYVEEIPVFTESSQHTRAFELWQGSQILLKFLELVKESSDFRSHMRDYYPSLTGVLETMERKSPLNFLSIVVQEAGDLSSIVASVRAGGLIRIESEGFIEQDNAVSTTASLFQNEMVLQAVLLDFSGTFLKGDISSILNPISSSSISAIDLDYCNLGDWEVALSQLEEAFSSNQTVAHLGLAGNRLGDEGARAVGRILQSNNKLLLLTLGDNSIGPNGAEALAYGLQGNSTLCFLNLAFNQLEDGGAWNFVDLLCSNTALKKVSLPHCGISEFSQSRLQSKAESFSSSKKLDMKETPLDITDPEGLTVTEEQRKRRVSSSLY